MGDPKMPSAEELAKNEQVQEPDTAKPDAKRDEVFTRLFTNLEYRNAEVYVRYHSQSDPRAGSEERYSRVVMSQGLGDSDKRPYVTVEQNLGGSAGSRELIVFLDEVTALEVPEEEGGTKTITF